MKRFRCQCFLWVLLTLSLILSSCQTKPTEVSNTPVPTPKAEEGLLMGIVQNLKGEPLEDIPVRLAQIYRQGEQGAFVLDLSHSPSSIATTGGKFVVLAIPPAEYLVVVGKPEDNNYIIYQGKDGKPITYTIAGGQTIDIGTIQVDFTP